MARRRYQEGYLFIRGKRKKQWVARWREDVMGEDGRLERVQRTVVIGAVSELSKRAALNELKKRLGPMNEGMHRAQATITFGKFAQKWEEAILPTYRASTRYFYHNTLHRHLLPQFAAHRLCDIQASDVQLFLTRKAERYAPSVLRHIRATLSRIFAAAAKWKYADANPAEGVELPSKRSVRPKTTFKPTDVQGILTQLAQPYRSMVIMAALTGMRASEFFALTWADVDFERALISVRRTVYRGQFGPPKTASSERAVPMGPLLADALREHQRLARSTDSGLVFCDAAGKPHDAGNLARRVLTPVLKTLGLPNAGWRAFRRSVATALSELHEPVRTAQQVLGHSSPTTTLAFYTQTEEKSQRDALSKLEELLFPTVPKSENSEELIN
jgi:integrase